MVAGTCNGSITPPQIVHFSRSDFWFVKVICIHLSFNFSVKDCVWGCGGGTPLDGGLLQLHHYGEPDLSLQQPWSLPDTSPRWLALTPCQQRWCQSPYVEHICDSTVRRTRPRPRTRTNTRTRTRTRNRNRTGTRTRTRKRNKTVSMFSPSECERKGAVASGSQAHGEHWHHHSKEGEDEFDLVGEWVCARIFEKHPWWTWKLCYFLFLRVQLRDFWW